MKDYIWYLSYGSNMLLERFLCYIKGGRFKDGITEEGCRDKSLPLKTRNIIIPHKVFYGGKNNKWGGGVAFLSTQQDGLSICRMHLITKEQFVDVFKQENSLEYIPDINFEKVIKDKHVKLLNTEYGSILFLGYCEGYPIFTFTYNTCPKLNAPTKSYVETINKGIAQMDINQYLDSDEGIKEIKKILKQCKI